MSAWILPKPILLSPYFGGLMRCRSASSAAKNTRTSGPHLWIVAHHIVEIKPQKTSVNIIWLHCLASSQNDERIVGITLARYVGYLRRPPPSNVEGGQKRLGLTNCRWLRTHLPHIQGNARCSPFAATKRPGQGSVVTPELRPPAFCS